VVNKDEYLLNFYAIYEAQNADNARVMERDLTTNSVKFMLVTSSLLKADSSVCN